MLSVEIVDVVLGSLVCAPPLALQSFNDRMKREDALRQGRGEALGLVSCYVFVAFGERRPRLI